MMRTSSSWVTPRTTRVFPSSSSSTATRGELCKVTIIITIHHQHHHHHHNQHHDHHHHHHNSSSTAPQGELCNIITIICKIIMNIIIIICEATIIIIRIKDKDNHSDCNMFKWVDKHCAVVLREFQEAMTLHLVGWLVGGESGALGSLASRGLVQIYNATTNWCRYI